MPKTHQEIIEHLEIIDAASEGTGVGKVEGKVIFVDKAIPGDIITAGVYKKEKKNWRAEILDIEVASPYRIQPICKHFGVCGGCSWQHFSYEGQLKFKEKYVRDTLGRIAGLELEKIEFLPIIGAKEIFGYRNKIEYSFSTKRWLSPQEIQSQEIFDTTKGVVGFHVPKYFDKVIDIQSCYLQPEEGNQIRNAIREYAHRHHLSFYNIKENQGFLRSLILRRAGNNWMVILCTGTPEREPVDKLFKYLQECFPFIQSFIWVYNPKLNDSYTDLPYEVWGNTQPFLVERLGKYQFQISPLSFFQTNTYQAENLYRAIANYIKDKKKLIYDLYCGTGSIGIYISEKAEQIIGIEYSASSIVDARKNADLNGLSHLEFFVGDIAKLLNKQFFKKYGKPDLVIADPPRSGIAPSVVNILLEANIPEIIYVSCNPATQARDLQMLKQKYKILSVQPVDMFPQTAHVENVVYLQAHAIIHTP
ncbi:MAG: 23S rRNA (uracil(1939)-C(5))-methyltransferase RlmD [Bacteroidia bacterium]|nr:23S rRNA (uracil(1939)-C(5))-methyltransferase RlmD [Bacteroidia bacterium]MDW8158823.1 23S rRNA (uracil(1939)-C(5))-methyltransferase RlmD [Bacteroidia bacterium]